MLLMVQLTPDLIAWLRAAADDGQPMLLVAEAGSGLVEVLRSGGGELSTREQNEVRALLAAHQTEPLGARRAPR